MKMFKSIILLGIDGIFTVTSFPRGENNSPSFKQKQIETASNIAEDILLSVPQLIEKNGYPAETHEIKTEDGYLITIYRIPGHKMNNTGVGLGIPVMMMHGMGGTSSDWIINGPKQAIGYILANDGYDIWLGNARGSTHSKKHVSLDPKKDGKYWEFSFHEIGIYDVPACIDYILEKTGKKKLHYFGHSQGTTAFFVMASMKPKYNEKIILMQALAPCAFLSHFKNTMLKRMIPLYFIFNSVVVPTLGISEVKTPDTMKQFAVHELCNETSALFSICTSMLFSSGQHPDEVNITLLPLYWHHSSGIAIRQHAHFVQLAASGKFRQFDFGKIKNIIKYGQMTPPDYNFTKITAPVALHYADGDQWTVSEDVKLLYKKLPNAIGLFEVPNKFFSHVDYLLSPNAPTLLYDLMRKLMLKY